MGVSDDLWRVLLRAQRVAEQSEGAFDVTVGPVVRLWRRARRQHALPSPERLAAARKLVGYRLLRLIPEGRQVELLKPGMLLDLGGIAKGDACDQALAVLEKRGSLGPLSRPAATWCWAIRPRESPAGSSAFAPQPPTPRRPAT